MTNHSSPVTDWKDAEIERLQNQVARLKHTQRELFDAQQTSPVTADPEYPDAPMVCAELYQVIGYMAFHYGIMKHPDVQKALDNASQHKLVHADLLPWPKQDLPPSAPAQCVPFLCPRCGARGTTDGTASTVTSTQVPAQCARIPKPPDALNDADMKLATDWYTWGFQSGMDAAREVSALTSTDSGGK